MVRLTVPRIAQNLQLWGNEIGDAGMKSFSEALSSGALPQLTHLLLQQNQIGDAGLTSFSDALARGALTQLTTFDISYNKIGNAGLKSFSEALGRGALPSLKEVVVDNEKHPQLEAACQPRGIEIV